MGFVPNVRKLKPVRIRIAAVTIMSLKGKSAEKEGKRHFPVPIAQVNPE